MKSIITFDVDLEDFNIKDFEVLNLDLIVNDKVKQIYGIIKVDVKTCDIKLLPTRLIYPGATSYDDGYKYGYNDCIDEIEYNNNERFIK